MCPSPFDGSAVEYLLMQDITLSTLTISTVYAIIRVSMSARWELCTDTQQPDQVKKVKSVTDLKFLFYLFLWKFFPKATDWQLGIFTCKVAKKSVGKKTNHESNLYKWHICFKKKIHLTFTQSVKPDQLLSCLLITIRLALSHVKLLHC